MRREQARLFIGTTELRENGWTAAQIERLLGEPDATRTNPHGGAQFRHLAGQVEEARNELNDHDGPCRVRAAPPCRWQQYTGDIMMVAVTMFRTRHAGG